jgi:ABC-2 type transport system permease protein
MAHVDTGVGVPTKGSRPTPSVDAASDGTEPADVGHVSRLGLLASELRLVFRSVRNLVLLLVLALVPLVMGVVIKAGAVHSGHSSVPLVGQVTGNGLFLVFATLEFALPYFMPMAVAVVAGDALAGEASRGTLRYLLIAPVGRTRLLLVKLAGVTAFCVAATVAVVASALLSGVALFPVGPVTLLSGQQLPASAAFGRTLLIALLVCVSLLGVGAIGLFASSMTDTPIAAMAATVGLGVVANIANQIPQLGSVHPWLFAHDWLSFADLLRDPVYSAAIVHNLWTQLGYLAVFGSAAWARFTARDVLC